MKKEQQTDRIIRNKLKYHASATPDHLWDAIAAELPTDKKDNGGFWWMSGGLLGLGLMIGLAAFLLLGSEKEQTAAVAKYTDESNYEKAELPRMNELPGNIASFEIADDLTAENQDIASKKNAAQKNISNTLSPSTLSENTPNKKNTYPETKNNKKNSTTQATNIGDEVSANKEITTTKVVADANFDNLTVQHPYKLDLVSSSLTPFPVSDKELDWPSMLQDPKCATFGKWLKLLFYADAYVSPDVTFRELNSKEAEFESYAQSRKATETQLLSYSMGARVSVVSNYGLSVRTGLVFSQINERFNHETEEVRTTISTTKDGNGNIISVDTVIESGTRYIKTYNRYRMLDVPLLLGYEVGFKKFSLAINSGIYANLISRQRGDFLSPELAPVTFTSYAENSYPAFRNRLNLSLYGSIAFYYNLNEHWQLMLEPQLRYYLDPLTLSNYMVEQKYTTTGLITGLRYRF